MRYSDEELIARLQLGEDSGWEFKSIDFRGDRPTPSQRPTWADEIVAFANSTGGTLLLGVDDDGNLQGLSRTQLDETERVLLEVCRDLIVPEIQPQIYRVLLESRAFLLVEVPAGYAQHERDGRSYQRVGSSKRLMSSEERTRLAQRRGQARFRGVDEQPVPGTGFGTLIERLWKPLLSAEGLRDPENALLKLGLLTRDERDRVRSSVAGILFCTEQPNEFLPQAAIMAAAYRGADPSAGQADARTIKGPLDRQISDGIAFVQRNMRVGAYKDPMRDEYPEYSMRAVFEALVNAVVHRDYSIRGSRIRLRMFTDRLVINSPGSLANGMTIERMGDHQATRNETLASMLSRMSAHGVEGSGSRLFYMERRGDGVPVIEEETKKLTGLSPQYELLGDSELMLTLPAGTPEPVPHRSVVSVRVEGQPQLNADVLALYPDSSWQRAATDHNGIARLDLKSGQLPMTVFVAASAARPYVETGWIPSNGNLTVSLSSLSDGGSVIFPNGEGRIPELAGTLRPVLDNLGRTYLYSSNISINSGQPQPVIFRPGDEDIHLLDDHGTAKVIRIAAIHGQASVVQYRAESSA